MGRKHVRVLSTIEDVRNVYAFDLLNQDYKIDFSSKVKQVYKIEDLFKKIDYCVISSPTSTHVENGMRLIEAGIPTLIEKPLSSNSIESVDFFNECRKKNVYTAVGYVERWNPVILELKKYLRKNLIGKILVITTKRIGPAPHYQNKEGVLLDLGSHDINLIPYLLSEGYQELESQFILNKFEHDIYSAVHGNSESGVIINSVAGWISPLKERVIQLIGEKGILECNLLQQSLKLFTSKRVKNEWDFFTNFMGEESFEIFEFSINKKEPLLLEHLGFIKALKNKKINFTQLRSAVETQVVIEELYKKNIYRKSEFDLFWKDRHNLNESKKVLKPL